jgi:hypothetical protein
LEQDDFTMAANQSLRDYAKQAILAITAANSAAMIATLSQAEFLANLDPEAIGAAFRCWSFGLSLAVACWIFPLIAAMCHINLTLQRGRSRASRWEWLAVVLGTLCFFGAVIAFGSGCFILSTIFTGV